VTITMVGEALSNLTSHVGDDIQDDASLGGARQDVPVRKLRSTIHALIVDDEPPARTQIASLLRGESDIEVVAECGNGIEAVGAIERHEPDLVFLDVQMPGLDGFGVIERVRPRWMPQVVFVTAIDHRATQVFDAHALDFLLKPVEEQRFQTTLERVRQRVSLMQEMDYRRRVLELLEEAGRREPSWDRIAVPQNNRIIFIKPEEIDWIEAEGNYVRLHAGRQTFLVRATMQVAEQRFAARGFVRISRCALVNFGKVREWQPLFHGDSVIVLQEGLKLTATRAYRDRLDAVFSRLG
jgi:two-component system, LytTR family, response regulator